MNVRHRSQFKKDYRLMMKQGKDIAELDDVIIELAVPNPLPESYRDHILHGEFEGYRECHLNPDWLLIYGYEDIENNEQQLLLVRTGSHSELFTK
jgi:mRNA interferase YafQ